MVRCSDLLQFDFFLGACRGHGGQTKHHTELGVNKVATNDHDPGRRSHGKLAQKTATK